MEKKKKLLPFLALLSCLLWLSCNEEPEVQDEEVTRFVEVAYPTPNVAPDSVNEILGVVLHHTALPTVEDALRELTRPRGVSSHTVVDTDGTRYILAPLEAVTFHAGLSMLNGRERCNKFCIGLEFQGNTAQEPLTPAQIASGVEFLLPIITAHHIPLENIVTHKMVRDNFIHQHPEKRCKDKVDLSTHEYIRFMDALKSALDSLESSDK